MAGWGATPGGDKASTRGDDDVRDDAAWLRGSRSGFGFGAAKALAAKGHSVFATMRGVDSSNAAKAAELRR